MRNRDANARRWQGVWRWAWNSRWLSVAVMLSRILGLASDLECGSICRADELMPPQHFRQDHDHDRWTRLPSPWETLAATSSDQVTFTHRDGSLFGAGDFHAAAPPAFLSAERLAMWPPPEAKHQQAMSVPVSESEDGPTGISRYRKGFWQGLRLDHRWIARPASGDFGSHQTRFSSGIAVPLPRRDWPLIIRAELGVRSFHGAAAQAVPDNLYQVGLRLLWLPRWSDRWGAVVAVMPGVYSDFEDLRSDAIRVTGLALVRWEWIPGRLSVAAGTVYLDRRDFSLLPAVGFTWKPNPDTEIEASLPRPRVARRVSGDGMREAWLYLAGELGGATWSIQSAGQARLLTARDYRVLLGWERRQDGGRGIQLEVGYVFARRLQFEGPAQEVSGQDSVLVRAGVSW